MLVIDGVKYHLWTPSKEEQEFHPMVRAHSKEIFGENSIYLDVKLLLKSASGIGSIPDAYVINLSKPYEWYVIENELSTHDPHRHIVDQLSRFISGIKNPTTRNGITDVLYEEINKDGLLKATVRRLIDTEDIHAFLSKLLSAPPRIVVVIEEITRETEEACQTLGIKDIVEFRTYLRENAENVRAHLFESLAVGKRTEPPEGGATSQAEFAVPILESLIEIGGSGKASPDILQKVYEKMKNKLTERDLGKVLHGNELRWRNRARWEVVALKNEGYLKKDSPRNVWEITSEGRKLYEELKAK